ncbi:MAG TPA: SHOCT domain-containing protein [Herpetosiphonaceae bacterium]
MSIDQEMEKLIDLYVHGEVSEDEFNQAKAALLARRSVESSASDSTALRKEVEYLRREHELAQLERDWKQEQEGYKVWGRYGARYIPTPLEGIYTALSVVIGIGLIISGVSRSDGALYVVFGLVLIIAGGIRSAYMLSKVRGYYNGEQRYQERRRQLASRSTSSRRDKYQ